MAPIPDFDDAISVDTPDASVELQRVKTVAIHEIERLQKIPMRRDVSQTYTPKNRESKSKKASKTTSFQPSKRKVEDLNEKILMLQNPNLRTENFLKKFIARDFRALLKDSYKYTVAYRGTLITNENKIADLKLFFTGKIW